MKFLTYDWRKKIILAKIFELPQSPTVILPHWCLFLVLLSDPIYLFSILTTYITTDGIEDCGEQLSYKDITGLLYYFLKHYVCSLIKSFRGFYSLPIAPIPFLEIEKSFSFPSHSTVPTTNFSRYSQRHPIVPSISDSMAIFWILFPPLIQVITHRVPVDIRVKKNRTISLRSKPIWCFLFRKSSTKSTES